MPGPERSLETPPARVPDGFDCVVHSTGRAAAWLRLTGELDLVAAPRLKACLDDALASAWLVVVDLRALTFIDGSGVVAILAADERARRSGRRLVLVHEPAQVTRLIDLAVVDDRLEITDLTSVLDHRTQGAPASSADTRPRTEATRITLDV